MILNATTILFTGAAGLLLIGLAGMVLSSHLYRMLLGLAIAEAGANLMLVIAGFKWHAAAPIIEPFSSASMVDPVPQAMVLTAIVIGVGVQALALTLIIRIKRAYGTLDMREVKRLMEEEIDHASISNAQPANVPATEARDG